MAVRTWKGNDTKADTGDEFYDVTFAGRVLSKGEYNWHDDSDFYALVWDDEKDEPREVTYASTRGWTYNNSASIDADDETKAKFLAYSQRLRDEREARIVRVGKTVRVVRGRKVPVGTEGTVTWYGEGRYGYRVGVKDADGKVHWTSASNVEVVKQEAGT